MMNYKEKESKEIASKLTSTINIMGISPEQIATMLTHEHRTLQEDFAMICMYFLEKVASDDYQYDGRNQGAHELAKQFINPNFKL